MIRFDGVSKQYPDGTVAVDDLSLEAPTGQITVLVGPVGLRQDHLPAHDQPDDRADVGHDLHRRPGHRARWRRPSCAAASATSSSTPGLFPHRTVLDNVATVPLLLGERQDARPATRAMELLERVGLRPGVRQALPRPAVRRPAAARRGRPRAGGRPAGDADGRAVQRGRPGRARAAAGRVPAPAGRARQDHRLRHPRHRRGDQARRPGGRPARRRHLAQLADPAYLLAHPVDDFVADFVGRDRGYRALASSPRRALPLAAGAARSPIGATPATVAPAPPTAGCWSSTRTTARWAGSSRRGSTGDAAARDGCTAAAPSPRPAGRCAPPSTPRCPQPEPARRHRRRRRRAGRHGARARGARPRSRGRRGPRSSGGPRSPVGRRRHDLVPRPPRRGARPARSSTSTSPGVPLLIGLLLALPLGWLARRYRLALPAAHRRLRPALHDPLAGAVRPAAAASRHPDPRPGQRPRRA